MNYQLKIDGEIGIITRRKIDKISDFESEYIQSVLKIFISQDNSCILKNLILMKIYVYKL